MHRAACRQAAGKNESAACTPPSCAGTTTVSGAFHHRPHLFHRSLRLRAILVELDPRSGFHIASPAKK